MHPNPRFRQQTDAENLAFVRRRCFGTLIVNNNDGPLVSHVPFWLSPRGDRAEVHLVKSNPITEAVQSQRAVLAVTGPNAYLSPDWYGVEDQVPTWNYVAVHLRGALTRLPPEMLRAHLERLSAQFEAELDKPPWTVDKVSDEQLVRMMRQIEPFEMMIEQIDGTWKLSQNKPTPARYSAAEALEQASGFGQEHSDLAKMMLGVE